MCGKAFEKEEEFREHIRTEHAVAYEKFDLCDKQINQESLLAMNHETRSKDKCDDCGVKDNEMIKLRNDLKIYRKEAEDLANQVSEKELVVESKCKEMEKMKKRLEKLGKDNNKKIKDQKEELQES